MNFFPTRFREGLPRDDFAVELPHAAQFAWESPTAELRRPPPQVTALPPSPCRPQLLRAPLPRGRETLQGARALCSAELRAAERAQLSPSPCALLVCTPSCRRPQRCAGCAPPCRRRSKFLPYAWPVAAEDHARARRGRRGNRETGKQARSAPLHRRKRV